MSTGPPEEKELATGLHRVRDIFCKQCLSIVGWTYVSIATSNERLAIDKAVKYEFLTRFAYRIWRIAQVKNIKKENL